MKVSEIKYENLTNDVIDKMLFEGILDDGIDGDYIIVFGSRKAIQYRVPKAVEIYKNNRAKKIPIPLDIIGFWLSREYNVLEMKHIK